MSIVSCLFGRSGSVDRARSTPASSEGFDQVGMPYGRVQNSIFGEATASDSRIPHYRDPSPLEQLPDQRRLRTIARNLYRTNPRIQSVIDKKVEITFGTSIRPKTRYRELGELFMAACDQFDTRGETDFAGLMSEVGTGLPPEKFSNRIRQAGWLRSAHTPGSWFSPRSVSMDCRMLASDGRIDRSGPRGCRWHRIFRDGLIRAIHPGGDASVEVSGAAWW